MFNDAKFLGSYSSQIFRNVRQLTTSRKFRDGEVTLFGREFQVLTSLFTKKLSRIVAQEQKLFLTYELNDSLRMLILFPRTLDFGPDISTFFPRFSGFILSLLLKTLYVSIKSPLILLCCNVFKLSLLILFSYSSLLKPVGILVDLLCTLIILSMSPCKCGFHACTAYLCVSVA